MKTRIAPVMLALVLFVGATACSKDASTNDVRKEAKKQLIQSGVPEKQADCALNAMTDKQITLAAKGAKEASAIASDRDYIKRITKCLTGGK